MTDTAPHPPARPDGEKALESWKEISAYLKRAVRTVKRWEKDEALPVHRHVHQSRSSVYAYPSELDAWWATRHPAEEEEAPQGWLWSRPARIVAFAAMLLLTLFSAGSGSAFGPASSAAQGPDVVVRRVWPAYLDDLGSPSADGHLLSFVDWSTGDLAVREIATGQNRRLTNKGTWSESDEYAEYSLISPDAQQVAYAWYNGTRYELRVIQMDGSGVRSLHKSNELAYVQPSSWTPDGKKLVAVFARRDRTHQIVVVNVADGAVQVLKSFDWRYPNKPSLSPDGRFIAYSFAPQEEASEQDVFVLAADGSREARAVEHPAHDTIVGWAPDGEQLLFASDRTGAPSLFSQRIVDGRKVGEPVILKRDLGLFRPVGITSNGSLYFSTGGVRDVVVAEFDTATGTLLSEPKIAVQRFVGRNFFPAWSPDGRSLAYLSGRGASGGGPVLVIRSLETGEEREVSTKVRLIPNPRLGTPQWSPDGRSILVLARDDKGRRGAFQINLATGAATPLVLASEGVNVRGAWWADGGKSIVFGRGVEAENSNTVVRRELASGTETILYRSRHLHAGAVSPDGRLVAISTHDRAKFDADTRENQQAHILMVLPVAGGPARTILDVGLKEEIKGIAWTGDSKHVLFTKYENAVESNPDYKGKVWRIRADGGEPQLIQFSLPTAMLPTLKFHPDGKRIAYTVHDETESAIWVMENFLPSLKVSK